MKKFVWITSLLLVVASAVSYFYFSVPGFSNVISAEHRSLFKFGMNCPIVQSFSISFTASSGSYEVRQHRCPAETLEHGGLQQFANAPSPTDIVLVTTRKIGRKNIVFGWTCEGECVQISPMTIAGGRAFLLQTPLFGSGGYSSWCVLGWLGDYVGCYAEASRLEEDASRSLQKGESTRGMGPHVVNGEVELTGQILGPGDSNCCPSRGVLHIVLTPHDGFLRTEKIYRTPN